MLVDASDEELIEKLVAVRGLGRWSVGMWPYSFHTRTNQLIESKKCLPALV
jgi:3-methyladenine DNA glycosylase/8-oxoguanine DNA glycosylase